MSESDADGNLPARFKIPHSFTEEFVEKNEGSLIRSENIQILIALGVLGLTGTLVAQNLISFPLLVGASESNLVLWGFRLLVYTTIVFLAAKLLTSTFYPSSKNRALIALHEWFEPFIYVFSTFSFGLLVFVVVLVQNTFLSFSNLIIILLAGIPSLILAGAYSQRRSAVYERVRDAKAEEIKFRILWNLFIEEAWFSGMEEDKLIKWTMSDESEEQIRTVLDEMASAGGSLVQKEDEKVKLTDRDEAFRVLKRNGVPESELREIVTDYIKSTPAANPESEDETIFYCHSCKKLFAESEMSTLQVEHRECPECAGGLDLHASPRDHRRE
ncbi:MAG: hypothetical protein U9O06_10395 [Euryarchaeota archaeon]|nr:hypothetical protein [Euryarchaeota archaeon]